MATHLIWELFLLLLRRLLLLLLALTLLALYANEHWMSRTLRVDARSHAQLAKAVDDHAEGGQSSARLELREGRLVLACEIRPGYQWPFCDLQLPLAADGALIDLSDFDRMRLWVRVSGPGDRHELRVFLRNADAAYARTGAFPDLKPHELVFDASKERMPVDVELRRFMVASWWVQAHPLPLKDSGPELDRVKLLSLTTGGAVQTGSHTIELEAAEFHGVWIAPSTFRLGVIGAWMLVITAYLLWDWRRSRKTLGQLLRRKSELQQANAKLKARSQEFEAKAHHDPLTGLRNRRGLQHDLALLTQAQEELFFPLAVVFVDIDHFKQVNDTHGHDVGDAVLKQFAQLLQANVQREDLLARWGGEEFLLLMPQTVAAEAATVAERLRQCVEQASWPAGLKLTGSFGVAQADEAQAMEAALKAADLAMYQAKQQGRNRVQLKAQERGAAPD
nr:GGDEF domain-containing protein [uncultured Roseateles sp.]